MASPETPTGALRSLWLAAGLDAAALQRAVLTGAEPVLASSFAVGTAAQAAVAAAALAATEIGRLRNGVEQQVAVDMRHAALACCTWFRIDGRTLPVWDKLSALYPCGSGGAVRLHTNFAHHRDKALRLLGLREGEGTEPAEVRGALQGWDALQFESAAADAGAVAAALRSFAEWDVHPQGVAEAARPVLSLERIGDAPPRALPPLPKHARPLHGLRVLDLTRILAGPVGTRALAAYGADVLLVNSPRLPNIDAIAETSRGKLSAHADLNDATDRAAFERVLAEADVLVQGYRPGALEALGFGPEHIAERHPGIVVVSLSAYSPGGPWAQRRGFDSMVQTASGFNDAEGRAAGKGTPRALPMQILDHGGGQLIALGAAAALGLQQREGGSWHVQVSLARTGHWLRTLGRVEHGFELGAPDFAPYSETRRSGFGELSAVRHAAQLSITPAGWDRESMPPGSHPLAWPQR